MVARYLEEGGNAGVMSKEATKYSEWLFGWGITVSEIANHLS